LPDEQRSTTSWAIYLARHTPAKWLGTVEADDHDAAIQAAAAAFGVKDPKRLVAFRRPE
jgi:hypothetical protein